MRKTERDWRAFYERLAAVLARQRDATKCLTACVLNDDAQRHMRGLPLIANIAICDGRCPFPVRHAEAGHASLHIEQRIAAGS